MDSNESGVRVRVFAKFTDYGKICFKKLHVCGCHGDIKNLKPDPKPV
jgi:hypothetical protein